MIGYMPLLSQAKGGKNRALIKIIVKHSNFYKV